jgi:hypothetical protein
MFLLDPHPIVSGVTASESGFIVNFDAIRDTTYTLQTSADLLTDTWSTTTLIITGDGRVASATNTAEPYVEFHRIVRLSP